MAVGDGPSHCDGCGSELNPGAKFCRNCGRSASSVVIDSPSPGSVATATPIQDAETSPAAEKTTSTPVVSPVTQRQEPSSPPASSRKASTEDGERYSNLKSAKWVIVAGVVAIVIIAGVVAFVLHSRSSQTNATVSSTSQPTSTTGISRTTLPRTTTSSSTSTTTLPPGEMPVDTTAVAGNSDVRQVVPTFETYFGGIDTQQYGQAYSAYSSRFQANTTEAGMATAWTTTRDTDVAITSLSSPNAVGDLTATVTFQSTQAAQDGPDGETCTLWSVNYGLVPEPSATASAPNGTKLSYFIDSGPANSGYPASCP